MSFDKQFNLNAKSKPVTNITATIVKDNSSSFSEFNPSSANTNTSFTNEVNNQDISGVFISSNDIKNDTNLINLLGQLDSQLSHNERSNLCEENQDTALEESSNTDKFHDEVDIVEQKSSEKQSDTEGVVEEQGSSIITQLESSKVSGVESDLPSEVIVETTSENEASEIPALIPLKVSPSNLQGDVYGKLAENIVQLSMDTTDIVSGTKNDHIFDEKSDPEPQHHISDSTSTSIENKSTEGVQTREMKKICEGEPQLLPQSSHSKTTQSNHNQHPISELPKPFDFQRFLGYMKNRKADPVVRYVRSFLTSFSKKTWSVDEQIKLITDFKKFIYDKFYEYEPFCKLSENEFDNSKEGLEKLIMNKLYAQCFSPSIYPDNLDSSHKQDLLKDSRLSQTLEKFNWVEGKHLDIEEKLLNSHFLKLATTELGKINNYRAPRDKVICLLNCCKIIFGFLKQLDKETNADAFIPLLIYIILKSDIKNLISNILYIERFRNENRLSGETGYYLSSLQGAITFIQELSEETLSVSTEEYEEHIKLYEERIIREKEERNRKEIETPSPQHLNQLSVNDQSSLSPSSVLLSSAGLLKNSISSLLSPSPNETSRSRANSESIGSSQQQHTANLIDLEGSEANNTPADAHNEIQLNDTYETLKQMFPNLDKAVIKDIIAFQGGNIGNCIDTCLELVNDV